MVNVHHLEDGGSIVGDRDVTVGADHQFVEPLAARMCDLMASLPVNLVCSISSLRIMKGRPNSSKAREPMDIGPPGPPIPPIPGGIIILRLVKTSATNILVFSDSKI